jgi:hypothetical protein
MLHYFPPVGAGVLVPGLVVIALIIVIPYFNINVEAEGIWLKDKARRVRIFGIVVVLCCIFLAVFQVWVALIPTLIIIAPLMYGASQVDPQTATGFRRSLVDRPLSYWIMTWFLFRIHRTHRHWNFLPWRVGSDRERSGTLPRSGLLTFGSFGDSCPT